MSKFQGKWLKKDKKKKLKKWFPNGSLRFHGLIGMELKQKVDKERGKQPIDFGQQVKLQCHCYSKLNSFLLVLEWYFTMNKLIWLHITINITNNVVCILFQRTNFT